jgi:hypothetical protein
MTDERPAWQQRVFTERDELKEKCDKLQTFLTSGAHKRIPVGEAIRLLEQLRHMRRYLLILDTRIEADFR